MAHFVEAARIANDWVARVDYKMEDQFFLMMFVTGLEEIRYKVQILEPKSLLAAMEFARFQEREFHFRRVQPHVQHKQTGNAPPSSCGGTPAADLFPYHCVENKNQRFDEVSEKERAPLWNEHEEVDDNDKGNAEEVVNGGKCST